MSAFGGLDGPDLARLREQTNAAHRDSAARRAGAAIREGIAEWRASTDERGERMAASLEALLALTQEQSEAAEQRERDMLAIARRNMWISVVATAGTFISTVAALIVVFG